MRALWIVLFLVAWPRVASGQSLNPDEWYFCYSGQHVLDSTLTGVPWDSPAATCEHLLWQAEPGNPSLYDSLAMDGVVAVSGSDTTGEAARLQMWVRPAQGIRSFDWHCLGTQTKTYIDGAGGLSGVMRSNEGTWFDSTGGFFTSAPSPSAGDPNTSVNLDAVGSFTALQYDRFFDDDPYAGWSDAGNTAYAYWWIEAVTVNDGREMGTQLTCVVTDWSSWPVWLDTNPEWEPAVGDISLPDPFLPISYTPISIISTTVSLDLVPDGDPVCYVVVPGVSGFSATVDIPVIGTVGLDIPSIAERDICVQNYTGELDVLDIDFVAWAVGLLVVAGIVALVKVMRS